MSPETAGNDARTPVGFVRHRRDLIKSPTLRATMGRTLIKKATSAAKANHSQPQKFEGLAWLLDVTESRQPLSETSPVWVRSVTVTEGPPTPHPERHPYCEISIILQGGPGTSMIEKEQVRRGAGEILLLGPGIPHWGDIERFPFSYITVHFLPWVLIELGPIRDGVRILRRFTAEQPAGDRVIRPSPKLRSEFIERFKELHREFEQPGFGREVRLRSLLIELLVRLLRWEMSLGRDIGAGGLETNWQPILKALDYMRQHYTE
ncbi:MAG: hypothetical protein FJ405_12140, partial [Verrucomicrobia bacterium]|nr:hypothetical protein [Verrucomicrobiota bacterium]